jgi:hypothetical protein
LACASHILASMRCLSILDDMCSYLHMIKITLLLCRWMHCRVFFFMLKCVSVAIKRFILGELFFLTLSFFALLPPINYILVFFIFYISTSIFFCLISYFWPWYFCKSFISFKFNYLISISHILLSLIWFLFF